MYSHLLKGRALEAAILDKSLSLEIIIPCISRQDSVH